MASKVTNEDILRINEIYYKTKVYAETARQTGFSASTIKKYVIPGWQPVVVENIKKFNPEFLPEPAEAANLFRGIFNFGYLCTLTPEEVEGIKELWKELAV